MQKISKENEFWHDTGGPRDLRQIMKGAAESSPASAKLVPITLLSGFLGAGAQRLLLLTGRSRVRVIALRCVCRQNHASQRDASE
jgi:hypothetical protein